MQNLKIAIVQTKQFWEDKSANLEYLEKTYFQHLKAGEVDILFLPEMFNTGFTMNAASFHETMDGPSIQWLMTWSKKLRCQIGASLIIKDNGQYFNRFVVVDHESVKNYYDKRHLFRMAEENEFYSAGKRRVIHHIKGWKLMLQVCYDLRFPVFSRNRTRGNKLEYDAVVYIANWPAKRATVWKNLIQARAAENQAFSIGLNRVGEDGNQIQYSGDSMVVDPWGNPQFQSEAFKEGLHLETLKASVLEEVRERFPAYLDAESEISFGESIITTAK